MGNRPSAKFGAALNDDFNTRALCSRKFLSRDVRDGRDENQ